MRRPALALLLGCLLWFVYVAAVVQFFTGRSLKGSE